MADGTLVMVRRWGDRTWESGGLTAGELEPNARNGIMAIFGKDFTFYSGFYVIAVMPTVNGNLEVI